MVMSSLLALSFLAARLAYTDSSAMRFLAFNLLLAWIPLATAMVLDRQTSPGRLRLLVLGATWLLFFPNAPYLVTDLIHLKPRTGVPLWFDIAMLGSFAWCGMILGGRSLSIAQSVFVRHFGSHMRWPFATGVALLTGLGIYVGRFLRLNSWDAVLDPVGVAHVITSNVLSEPMRAAGVTLAFGALTWVGHLSMQNRAPAGTS